MATFTVTNLLQQTRSLIQSHQLDNFLGLSAIQEGLEKTEREIAVLRAQPSARQNLMMRVAEAANQITNFILPNLSQAQKLGPGKQVWDKYKQICDLYESEGKDVAEKKQPQVLPVVEVRRDLRESSDLERRGQEDRTAKEPYPEETKQVDEVKLLNAVAEYQRQIEVVSRRTCWISPQQARDASNFTKVNCLKIAATYSELAMYYYYVKKEPLIGDRYWENGLAHFQMCCHYPTGQVNFDYQYWFGFSEHFGIRIQLSARGLSSIPLEKRIELLRSGLSAIEKALKLMQKPEAIFRKWMYLQNLLEAGIPPPEPPIEVLRIYLDRHPDPFSEEYLEQAQLYGGDLAKNKRLKEAYDWLIGLLEKKDHPLTYFYLGKVCSQMMDRSSEALTWFQKAAGLDPMNLEIRFWLVSEKAKNTIQEMRSSRQLPSQEKCQQIVDIANEFCDVFLQCEGHLDEKTSIGIPLRKIAEHFFYTLIPEMAGLLARLRQFRFSLFLYQRLLDCFDYNVRSKFLDESQRVNLHAILGTNHYFLQQFEEAERHHRIAIGLDKTYLISYENIIGVYSELRDVPKLLALHEEVRLLMRDPQIVEQREKLASIFFNFGSAYACLGKEWLGKSQECYQVSFEFNEKNWGTRIHLARILVLLNRLGEGFTLLDPYFNRTEPKEDLGESPQQDFQIKFCLAGICALLDQPERARKLSVEAAQTRFDPEEVVNLQRYINEHKDAKLEMKSLLAEQIVTSIRKMGFDFRVGKIVNPKPVILNENECVGYHGTIDVYLDEFKEGIHAKKAEVRQYRGKGFYIAPDREIACYFAMKKARDEQRGVPVLLKVYATQELVGKEIAVRDKVTTEILTQYNFTQSAIEGFEVYSQYYVFENSLNRVKVKGESELVGWTEEEYEAFQRKWTRQQH